MDSDRIMMTNDKRLISKEPGEVQSVVKTLKILEALAEHDEITQTDLATLVGGHKSTVYRFMCTLIEQGYAKRTDKDLYSPTLKLFQIGMCTYSRIDLVHQALPTLKRMAFLSEETVHLAIESDNQLVYLHKIESTHNLRVSMQSRIGSSAPEYCTGVGKILLAWMSSELLEQYMARCPFVRFTPKTICSRLDLENELASIRERGYCYDDEEHESGVRCIAAPIRDYYGAVIASISISGPTVRLDDARMDSLAELVVSSAEEISQSVGWVKK